MFNEEQKKRYVGYCGNDSKVISLFQYIEKFEKAADKDVCQMHTEEILDILRSMSKTTAVSERSRLIKYIEWCRANGFCKVNWLDKKMCPREKFIAVLDAAEDKYYISPQKYAEYLEQLKKSPKSYDALYDLPIFMAMYEGVREYINLAYLTTDDINLKAGTLRLYDSGEIRVSKELLHALLEASKIDYLNNKAQRSALRYSFQKNSIWKSSKEIDENGQVTKFRRRFMKIKEALEDDKLTISNISNSGIFNYIVKRTGEDGLNLLADASNTELNKNQLNLKYQKYFLEKQLALNFWEFRYRFQDYFKFLN